MASPINPGFPDQSQLRQNSAIRQILEDVQGVKDTYATIASPTFTGDPKAPTPASSDNDTSIATTAFVKAQNYITSASAPVQSVNGDTGAVTVSTASIGAAGDTAQTDFISGLIELPDNKDYLLVVKSPIAMTIVETTTKSVSGTCTATFKINTTALGGTANSVSSTEQSQAHASANAAAVGDDIVLTVSSNSSCDGLSFTIKFTRDLAN